MSSRNIRKYSERIRLVSSKNNPTQEELEEFEPNYVNKPGSSYALLLVNDSSLSDEENSANEQNQMNEEPQKPKKKNKNNRKKKQKSKRRLEQASNSSDDEIDTIVAEVNQMLGVPEPPKPVPQEPPPDMGRILLKINHKHLDPEEELNRVFGPDDEEEARKRRPGRYNLRLLRRQIILTPENYSLTIKGLTMKLVEVKDGVKYFKFQHSLEYQKNMKSFIEALKAHHDGFILPLPDPEVFPRNTVESLLENLNLYFQVDENNLGVKSLEEVICILQSTFDSWFNFVDGKTRLEYKYVENRPFHLALLMYLHILTNKACHRTAMEVAKLMLNLDPSDPLGVIFILDTVALRAREHAWLADLYKHWAQEKDANRLFNVQYSCALALYHLYLKSKKSEDLLAANEQLTSAVIMYPNVVVMLMEHCKQNNSDIMNHDMFTSQPNYTTSPELLKLQELYVAFAGPKWREDDIIQWAINTALEVLALYKTDATTKATVQKAADERSRLFRKYPLEIKRHLHAISSMSDLLVDGAVPDVERSISFNPYPRQGCQIDGHGYYTTWGMTPAERRNVMQNFLASLIPLRAEEVENNGPENREGDDVLQALPNDTVIEGGDVAGPPREFERDFLEDESNNVVAENDFLNLEFPHVGGSFMRHFDALIIRALERAHGPQNME